MQTSLIQKVTEVAAILTKSKRHLVSVESCTGGGLGYYCTSQPKSSDWYHCGYVTYQNSAKEALGVPAEVLQEHGAVSEATALAMAKAALTQKDTDKDYCSVAITGIAGPDGGSEDKPVGTVCFAWDGTAMNAVSSTQVFDGNRQSIREQAIAFALNGIIDFIKV